MKKPAFKSYAQGQITLFPPVLMRRFHYAHPRHINQIVDNIDISRVFDTYKGGGTSAYHPHMMFKVVLYSYLNNM